MNKSIYARIQKPMRVLGSHFLIEIIGGGGGDSSPLLPTALNRAQNSPGDWLTNLASAHAISTMHDYIIAFYRYFN